MLERVQTTSDQGRKLDVTVAVGERDDSSTELHLLGAADYRGQRYAFRGSYRLREGRDTPEVTLFRCDSGERLIEEVALDILYAICVQLDERVDGIMQSEMDRICG